MTLDLVTLAILALGSYRLTRLVVLDAIWEVSRLRLMGWLTNHGFLGDKLAIAIGCTFCTGFWVTGVVMSIYWFGLDRWTEGPFAARVLEYAAVWGLQSLLHTWEPGDPDEA